MAARIGSADRKACPSSAPPWAAANQRKIDAVQLADALDDIEARIDELLTRTKKLELD